MTGAWDAMLAHEVANPLERRRQLARKSKAELIDIIQDFEAGAAGAALGSAHALASETLPLCTVPCPGLTRDLCHNGQCVGEEGHDGPHEWHHETQGYRDHLVLEDADHEIEGQS